MAKATWDKVVHATVTHDARLTQDDWHHLNRTTQPAPDPAPDPEVRYYNPSGPFYTEPEPPPAAPPPVAPLSAKKEIKK